MEARTGDGQGGPKAISRALVLFEVLVGTPEGLSLADLSVRLNLPKSTLLNSLRPLEGDGYLIAEGSLYRLGPRAFRLASEIGSSWSLPRLMRGYLHDLMNEADETALLSILDERAQRFVHIDAVESRNRVRYVTNVGTGGPLYASASGRVLLAFQPEAYQEAYLSAAHFEALTSATTTDAAVLRRILQQVREDRYAMSVGEIDPDGGAIAAPVIGPRGAVVAAVGVALPLTRLRAREAALICTVRDIAWRASGETAKGGHEPPNEAAE